eukprot:454126-Rhodomonas_salina.1
MEALLPFIAAMLTRIPWPTSGGAGQALRLRPGLLRPGQSTARPNQMQPAALQYTLYRKCG